MLILNIREAQNIILRDRVTKEVFAKIMLSAKEGNVSCASICFEAPDSTEIIRDKALLKHKRRFFSKDG